MSGCDEGRSVESWRGGLSGVNFRVAVPEMVDLICERFSSVVH